MFRFIHNNIDDIIILVIRFIIITVKYAQNGCLLLTDLEVMLILEWLSVSVDQNIGMTLNLRLLGICVGRYTGNYSNFRYLITIGMQFS